ncbi:MAG: DUF4406 domain-containing protein [Candidatus Omnitrophica bacterium]|nr:DUF4406 domain-containing protein [Candidatus Omnitrophota bacterium]
MNKLLYVAGPYSGDTADNIARAEEVSIGLIRKGFHVFTPHKNMAGYEQYEGNGIGYKTWMDMDLDFLRRCDAMYVMLNSERSVGVQKELKFARRKKIPVIHEMEYPYSGFTLEMYAEIIEEK